MLTALIVAAVLATEPPPDGPRSEGRCTASTYQLEINEYIAFGTLLERAQNHCATVNIPDAPRYPGRSYVIGRTPIARFRLFGEQFGLNLNLVTQAQDVFGTQGGFTTGQFGANRGSNGNDLLFVSPSLDLPDAWDAAIDEAAGPIALVGGVAITTAVLIGLLGR
ncbi:MAG: hypothetical protein AAF658_22360 [Myxococcota bacterium]